MKRFDLQLTVGDDFKQLYWRKRNDLKTYDIVCLGLSHT